MSTYRIVVGVDGSDGGQRALRWAVHEAAARNGSVQVVTAWAPAASDAPPAATEVVRGRAVDALTAAARDADLLVLGSHGHGRLHHAALGSVSDACVRKSACPVVILPPPHQLTVPARDPAVRP